MNHPAPRHIRTTPTTCPGCHQPTYAPGGTCNPCTQARDDQDHAAAEHHIETHGWTADHWDLATDEYDHDEAFGAYAPEVA